MFSVVCRLTSFLICVISVNSNLNDPFSDAFIDDINRIQSSWRAGRNFPPDTKISTIKSKLGSRLKNWNAADIPRLETKIADDLPTHFDARDHWPACKSIISEIVDQGTCGNCWAVSAVSAMNDRICIRSGGSKQVRLSANHVTNCCSDTKYYENHGCDGADPEDAWKFWKEEGIVSGGWFGSKEGCQNYPFPPCDHTEQKSFPFCIENVTTPACLSKCDEGSSIDFATDRHYALSYGILDDDEAKIKSEIYANGPIQAAFFVYEDFFSYRNGVYHYVKGDNLGGHAFKVIGWGEENGLPYWLGANIWNEKWADGGYFKILRGEKTVRVNEHMIAGIPKID